MSIFRTAENWLVKVALRKATHAVVGFMASTQAIQGLEWLNAHGLNLQFDPARFETEMTIAGIAAFTAGMDWLKLKYPNSKWL